jgi:hypothetical protein
MPRRCRPSRSILTTDGVQAVPKPIWTTKAETASRVRGRIEKVPEANTVVRSSTPNLAQVFGPNFHAQNQKPARMPGSQHKANPAQRARSES